MALSIFQLFNIGIGPSSSHTVGPMRASARFIQKLKKHNVFAATRSITIELYGSLSATGIGHGTDRAIMGGLLGHLAESVDIKKLNEQIDDIKESGKLLLNGEKEVLFAPQTDLIFKREYLPFHPNGMIYYAHNDQKEVIYKKYFYSIGGGFIVGQKTAEKDKIDHENIQVKHPFNSAAELLSHCKRKRKSISDIIFENELCLHTEEEIYQKIDLIWNTMKECIQRGLKTGGLLPGRLMVERRAKKIYKQLKDRPTEALKDPLTIMDWVNLYALAVNEENASGGRVVTAPTNGAAGIVPAVLMYYDQFCNNQGLHDIRRFLLTAGGIGILYKKNASISGAEVGCQGEVGVACSMAAAGLAEVLGGGPLQVENAAEIAMEHNLGLTCDPIDGQVQIPCIERNAMGSIKAINAARIALKGKGKHYVSLDQVMKTMKETGRDMKDKYKETSRGGLAVNVTEC